MDQKLADSIRMMRARLNTIEVLMQEAVPHVDDRDEAYYRATKLQEAATQLIDLIGNTTANDSYNGDDNV